MLPDCCPRGGVHDVWRVRGWYQYVFPLWGSLASNHRTLWRWWHGTHDSAAGQRRLVAARTARLTALECKIVRPLIKLLYALRLGIRPFWSHNKKDLAVPTRMWSYLSEPAARERPPIQHTATHLQPNAPLAHVLACQVLDLELSRRVRTLSQQKAAREWPVTRCSAGLTEPPSCTTPYPEHIERRDTRHHAPLCPHDLLHRIRRQALR